MGVIGQVFTFCWPCGFLFIYYFKNGSSVYFLTKGNKHYRPVLFSQIFVTAIKKKKEKKKEVLKAIAKHSMTEEEY